VKIDKLKNQVTEQAIVQVWSQVDVIIGPHAWEYIKNFMSIQIIPIINQIKSPINEHLLHEN